MGSKDRGEFTPSGRGVLRGAAVLLAVSEAAIILAGCTPKAVQRVDQARVEQVTPPQPTKPALQPRPNSGLDTGRNNFIVPPKIDSIQYQGIDSLSAYNMILYGIPTRTDAGINALDDLGYKGDVMYVLFENLPDQDFPFTQIIPNKEVDVHIRVVNRFQKDPEGNITMLVGVINTSRIDFDQDLNKLRMEGNPDFAFGFGVQLTPEVYNPRGASALSFGWDAGGKLRNAFWNGLPINFSSAVPTS